MPLLFGDIPGLLFGGYNRRLLANDETEAERRERGRIEAARNTSIPPSRLEISNTKFNTTTRMAPPSEAKLIDPNYKRPPSSLVADTRPGRADQSALLPAAVQAGARAAVQSGGLLGTPAAAPALLGGGASGGSKGGSSNRRGNLLDSPLVKAGVLLFGGVDKYIAVEAMREKQKEHERSERQASARSEIVGGHDPRTGINWNTGRPMSDDERRAAVARADPKAAWQAVVNETYGMGSVPDLQNVLDSETGAIQGVTKRHAAQLIQSNPGRYSLASQQSGDGSSSWVNLANPETGEVKSVQRGSPDFKALLDGGYALAGNISASASDPLRNQKIKDYVRQYGLSEGEATKLADGLLSTYTDQFSGNTFLVDKVGGTSRLLSGLEVPGSAPGGGGVPVAGGVPGGGPSPPEQLPILADVSRYGAAGAVPEVLEKATLGFFGADQATNTQRQRYRLLREAYITANARSGRPSNYAQQRVEELLPSTGAFESPARAWDALSTIYYDMADQLQTDRAVSQDNRYPVEMRREALASANSAERVLNMIGDPSQFPRPKMADAALSKPIADMSLQELESLDTSRLSDSQVNEAESRWNQLNRKQSRTGR